MVKVHSLAEQVAPRLTVLLPMAAPIYMALVLSLLLLPLPALLVLSAKSRILAAVAVAVRNHVTDWER